MRAKTEIATARSGHLSKGFVGLAKTGCEPWEREPRVVKKEMTVLNSNLGSVFYCVLNII